LLKMTYNISMSKEYFTYIMTNQHNTVLYTGITHDIAGRVWQHKEGKIEGFTKRYNVDKLVYYESYADVNEAILREKQIKGWLRAKKVSLIEEDNESWEDLSRGWFDD
jgi:putative endonuclease